MSNQHARIQALQDYTLPGEVLCGGPVKTNLEIVTSQYRTYKRSELGRLLKPSTLQTNWRLRGEEPDDSRSEGDSRAGLDNAAVKINSTFLVDR